MVDYNQLFYSIFSLIAFGLGLSSYVGFKDNETYFKTEVFWSISIYLFMFSTLFWAIAPVTSLFFLTLANTCLVGSALSNVILLKSFTRVITQSHLVSALLLVIFFGIAFEHIREGEYINRILLTSPTLCLFLALQIKELKALIRIENSIYLKFTYFLSMLMLGIMLYRFYPILHTPENFKIDIYHETALPLYGRMTLHSLFLLYFIFIGHYFYEKVWNKAHLTLDLKKAQILELEDKAYYDNLTGLPNRLLLMDRLTQAMSQVKRRGGFVAVLFIDLDGFKAINDHYGHEVGDAFLVAISQHMKSVVIRDSDTLARLGGDEFVILLENLSHQQDLEKIIPNILKICSADISLTGLNLNVSASIGCSLYPMDSEGYDMNAETLLNQADQAMYFAKRHGKNTYRFFNRNHDVITITRNNVIGAIQSGLKHDEFKLYYQPNVNMRTGEVFGFEALIRWHKDESEVIEPFRFLPLVKNKPLAVELGYWVIKTAVAQLKNWQAQGLDTTLSINIDARQLLQANFVDYLKTQINTLPDYKHGDLVLEILESTAIDDQIVVTKVIDACRMLGVEFALDDFGTGYSSISYLSLLPIKTLKIDRSFIDGITRSDQNLQLVINMIRLANDIGKQVIAEGVETVEQGELLIKLGCECAQGFGIAKPMPAEDVLTWISAWQPCSVWQGATNNVPNYHLLFEHMSDPVVITMKGRFIDCNSAAVNLLGYPHKESLINQSVIDISPVLQPDGSRSEDSVKANIERVQNKGSHQIQWAFLRSDGSQVLVDIMMTAMTLNGNHVLYSVWRELSH